MWLCQSEEAKKQMEICNANNCPDCEKCIWITESSNAMEEYGTVIDPVEEKHPLYDMIKETFDGEEIN